jgi:hypothetical protein
MFGPGAYRPDPTEGITAIADLPPPEIVPASRTYTRQACPRCGHQAYRDKQYQRTLHDLGNLDLWCPRDLIVTYAQHDCTKCRQYCHADPGSFSFRKEIANQAQNELKGFVPRGASLRRHAPMIQNPCMKADAHDTTASSAHRGLL